MDDDRRPPVLPLDRFMVGTGAAALADAVAAHLARRCELGYAGALVLPPFYYKGLDVDSVTGYFRVADRKRW